jgi:UDP-N-acetylglucosamine 2-epimerase (non-hydrolysing)
VVTLHRPSNVDNPQVFEPLLQTLAAISERLPVVFPMHPRTRSTAEKFGLAPLLERPGIRLMSPLSYLEMLGLNREATVVITDSGGLQEETTALGVPCITVRQNTERPITMTEGTNTLTGPDPAKILACFDDILATGGKTGRIPEYWDGQAAVRIADHLRGWLDRLA